MTRGRRFARMHERGVVVSEHPDPRRDDRRDDDVPADPHRTGPSRLADRRRQRAGGSPTKPRTTTTSGARSRTSTPAQFAFPHVPAWPGVRLGLSELLPAGPVEQAGSGPGLAGQGRDDRRSRRRHGRTAGRARSDRGAVQRRCRARRGQRLRPRQLPVRPLHRSHGAARGRALLRAQGHSRVPEHEGRPTHGFRGARPLGRQRPPDSGPVRRRQRRRERVRDGVSRCRPGTLGPALVFGLRAGDAAAAD